MKTIQNQIPVLEQPISPSVFTNSRSAMQLIPKEFDDPVKEVKQRIDQFVDNRLNEENWLGTLIIPLVIYGRLAAPQKPELSRVVSRQLFIIEKIWAFFSARGAAYPKGEKVTERIANTILNPQASSLQLEYLLLLPSRLLQLQAHISRGLSKKADIIGKEPQNIRRIQAGLTVLWVSLLGIGHFKKRPASTDEKAQDDAMPVYFKHSQSLKLAAAPERPQEGLNVNHVLKNAWKHDKPLLAGLFVETILAAFEAAEEWQKSNKTRETAFTTVRSAMTRMLITAAYSVYTLQRISRSNFKSLEEPTQVEKLSRPLTFQNSILVTSR